jgi:hypothetical protein
MSDATDQLATLTANNTADATALAALEADLNSTAPTTNDNIATSVVSAIETAGLVEVFTAGALSDALTAAGYTVTAPAPANAPKLPAEA